MNNMQKSVINSKEEQQNDKKARQQLQNFKIKYQNQLEYQSGSKVNSDHEEDSNNIRVKLPKNTSGTRQSPSKNKCKTIFIKKETLGRAESNFQQFEKTFKQIKKKKDQILDKKISSKCEQDSKKSIKQYSQYFEGHDSFKSYQCDLKDEPSEKSQKLKKSISLAQKQQQNKKTTFFSKFFSNNQNKVHNSENIQEVSTLKNTKELNDRLTKKQSFDNLDNKLENESISNTNRRKSSILITGHENNTTTQKQKLFEKIQIFKQKNSEAKSQTKNNIFNQNQQRRCSAQFLKQKSQKNDEETFKKKRSTNFKKNKEDNPTLIKSFKDEKKSSQSEENSINSGSNSESNSDSKSQSNSDSESESQSQASQKSKKSREESVEHQKQNNQTFTKAYTMYNKTKQIKSDKKQIKWIILPSHQFKQYWDILIIFLLIYAGTIMPYRIAFCAEDESQSWNITDYVIDFIFIFDVGLNFFTAFTNKNDELVTDRKKIVKNYLTGWFAIDLLASFPFTLILNSTSRYNNLIRILRLPKLYRLIRMTKLFRMVKAAKKKNILLKYLEDYFKLSAEFQRFLFSLCFLFYICHLVSCFWFLVAELEYHGPDTWTTRNDLIDSSNFEKYIASYYWTVQTVVTVGYGDIAPDTQIEQIFAILWMLIGVFCYSYCVGSLSSFISKIDSQEAEFNSQITILQRIKKKYRIQPALFIKIRNHLKYKKLQHSNFKYFFEQLPQTFQNELSLIIHKDLIDKIDFLKSKPPSLISRLCTLFKPIKIAKNNIIWKQNDPAEEMFFIKKGKVAFVIPEFNYFKFLRVEQGYYFGELDLLFYKEVRQYTVVATKETEVLSINKKQFKKIFLYEFKEIGKDLVNNAYLRKKRTKQIYKEAIEYLIKKQNESEWNKDEIIQEESQFQSLAAQEKFFQDNNQEKVDQMKIIKNLDRMSSSSSSGEQSHSQSNSPSQQSKNLSKCISPKSNNELKIQQNNNYSNLETPIFKSKSPLTFNYSSVSDCKFDQQTLQKYDDEMEDLQDKITQFSTNFSILHDNYNKLNDDNGKLEQQLKFYKKENEKIKKKNKEYKKWIQAIKQKQQIKDLQVFQQKIRKSIILNKPINQNINRISSVIDKRLSATNSLSKNDLTSQSSIYNPFTPQAKKSRLSNLSCDFAQQKSQQQKKTKKIVPSKSQRVQTDSKNQSQNKELFEILDDFNINK